MNDEEMSPEDKLIFETAMTALGDRVQATIKDARLPVIAVVMITTEGYVEYRSPLDDQTLKRALQEATDIL